MGEEGEEFAGEGDVGDELGIGFAQQVQVLHHFLHARGREGGVFFDGMQGGTVSKQELDDGSVGKHLRFPFSIAAHVDALVKNATFERLVKGSAVLSIRAVNICPAGNEFTNGGKVAIMRSSNERVS